MSDQPQSVTDMAAAELRIREAMQSGSAAARCDALMKAYWLTREQERDAFVAVLVARLTLVPDTANRRLPA